MKSEIAKLAKEIANPKTPTGKCGHCKKRVTKKNSGGAVNDQVYCEPCMLDNFLEILAAA